jgi:hypothetical protein
MARREPAPLLSEKVPSVRHASQANSRRRPVRLSQSLTSAFHPLRTLSIELNKCAMASGTYEKGGRCRFGPVGRTLLVVTAFSALGLSLFITPHVVALVALAHDVPNAWPVFDVVLIGLPVSALGIAIAAIVALIQGRLLPLWVCLGLFVLDVLILVGMFTTGLGVELDSNATIDFNETVPF